MVAKLIIYSVDCFFLLKETEQRRKSYLGTQQYKRLLTACSVQGTVLGKRLIDFKANYKKMPIKKGFMGEYKWIRLTLGNQKHIPEKRYLKLALKGFQ